MNKRRQGQHYEQKAQRFLERQGLRLINRNFSCRHGEIDLIMEHQDSLVFVEVRYRRQHHFGTGAETVDWRKQNKLIRSAQTYLQQHPQAADRPARFDVVSLDGDDCINWISDAFQL